MKILLLIILSCVVIISKGTASNDTTHTSLRNSYLGNVISDYEPNVTGQFNYNIWYKFIDTTTFKKPPLISLPANWNATFSNLVGNTYSPGDSINWTVTITYPTNNLSFYPEEINIKQYTNLRINPLDSNDSLYSEESITAKIYFTPYSSIEIWNLIDFQNLNRKWLYYEDNPNAQREYIDSANIPLSNLALYTIDWDSGNWEDDWKDDFREVEVEGLAYNILMKPVPPDSIEYYEQTGDGIDSTNERRTFTGRVVGYLMAESQDDFGNTIDYPLSGIRVKLMEKDLLWSETFASTYTDLDGYFDMSYSKDQVLEGDKVELYLKFKSRTNDDYKIQSTNFIGSQYSYETDKWSASQNAGTMDQGEIILDEDSKDYYDAFRVVHWGNKGYLYFENNNILLGKKLRFNINATGSWYNPYNVIATVNLMDDDADHENTPYHEFGHHTMFRMQNNNFTIPYGEDNFSHTWDTENTSRLAWVEGWADFIQMALDAAYFEEDNEYGFDEFGYPFEYRLHYSWPNSWNITNGFRSEYYFACALYDLWDGPNKGLPETMPHATYHGWNETGQNFHSWATLDDVEFDFNTLCQPIIQHQSGSGKIKNLQMFVDYLISIVNDCSSIADISRTMQENRVQWNVHEYEYGWHNSNFNTDELGETKSYEENPSFPGSQYTDNYDVTIFNDLNDQNYYLNSSEDNTQCFTDNIYLGLWDTYSSIFRTADLYRSEERRVGKECRSRWSPYH